MKWVELANKINGKLEDNPIGFMGGDTIVKSITKEDENEQIKIQKEIRRSYGASSFYNNEKLEIEYSIKNADFGRNRITRKNIFQRIGKELEAQFKIEGDHSGYVIELLKLPELNYLLTYPKSEFIVAKNSIKFKTQSVGEMKEELLKVFNSFEIVKNKVRRLVGEL